MRKGFTLVELIFVIVIVGILASVAVPKFLTTKKNAETANFPMIAQQVQQKAQEQYELIKEDNLSQIINDDHEISTYLDNLKTNLGNDFNWDDNETEFNITYGTNKAMCLRVKEVPVEVRVTADKNVSTISFDYEVNKSCNTE